MKNIKSYFIAALIGAFAISSTSCEKAQTEIIETKEEIITFTATTEQDETTKTQLGTTTDGATAVHWTDGDAVAVWYSSGDKREFTATAREDKTMADFSGEPVVGANSEFAIYPASFAMETSNRINIPAIQKYSENNVSDGVMPMYADASDLSSPVAFKNVCGVVKIQLKGHYEEVTKIELVSTDKIAGEATISYNGGAPELNFDETASNVITLDCSEGGGVQLPSQPLDPPAIFHIVVPPTMSDSFAIVVTTKYHGSMTKVAPASALNQIKRNTIITMPELTFVEDLPMTVDGFRYAFNILDNTATIYGRAFDVTASGELNIPSSVTYNGRSFDVTAIADNAFNNNSGYSGTLVIPDNIKSIGNYAFKMCTNFTDLIIGANVESIGNNAFEYCRGLTKLVIPSKVAAIGSNAFDNIETLTEVVCLGKTPPTRGNSIFHYSLGSYTLFVPRGTEDAYKSKWNNFFSFAEMPNLNYTFDEVNNTATATGLAAEEPINGIGRLIIPNLVADNGKTYKVTKIGVGAFSSCTGFTGELVIPNNLTSIEDGAFAHCLGLTGELNIPNNVTSIGAAAFSDCRGFTGELNIPNNVTSIGANAFSSCSGFSGLTISTGVNSIGNGVFVYCSGFTGELVIPVNVTEIDNYAFTGCSGFTGSLTIPDNVTSIGFYSFNGCSGFNNTLTLGSKVSIINGHAFSGTNFTKVVVTSANQLSSTSNSNAFEGYNSSNCTVEAPSAVLDYYKNFILGI